MLHDYVISEVPIGDGWLGIGPIPGRLGAYESDLAAILRWGADMVLTMVTSPELEYADASGLGADLVASGVDWRHLPVPDMSAPPVETEALWTPASEAAHARFEQGGKVFTHCYGGCGRAGMAVLRLMVEAGEDADPALERLRDVRACAVQTEAQRAWAAIPMFDRLGWTP